MKRKVILVLLVVLVCVSLVWAQENKKSFKPTFSFSASGWTGRDKEFVLNLESLYNQRFNKWGIQIAGMANVNRSIHEYGFSAGGSRQFGIMEFGLFFDALYLEKISEYGYGGFHGQIRPEFRIAEKHLMIDFFYAHPVTKSYVLQKRVSLPDFWQDSTSYYSDIVINTVSAVPMRYCGIGTEILPAKFLKFRAEGIYAPFEKDEFYRLRVGAEVRAFKWLALSIDWIKMKAIQVLGLNMGGDYQAVKMGVIIFLGRGQEYGFSNLTKYGVFTPQYPAVRMEEKRSKITTKIADLLKVELTVDPQSVCLGKPINYKVDFSGGTAPYTVSVDFRDNTGSDQSSGEYIYAKVGSYCIKATVSDSSGHSETDCKCVTVNDCRKKLFTLKVYLCEGVKGNLPKGELTFEEGTVVDYGYETEPNYENLSVRLDGTSILNAGRITMDTNHTLVVCADKKNCLPAKILSYSASKTEITAGEEVTLSWITQNAPDVFLNGQKVAANDSQKVKPTQTTVYTLKASNSCPSSDILPITITVKSCNLCDSVFFHADGSSTLVRNNLSDGQDISFDFQVYNQSQTCSFDVPIRWKIEYQQSSKLIISGQTSIGVIPPKTVWNMKFFYNYKTKQVTITKKSTGPITAGNLDINCEKVQVKLGIGNCGGV